MKLDLGEQELKNILVYLEVAHEFYKTTMIKQDIKNLTDKITNQTGVKLSDDELPVWNTVHEGSAKPVKSWRKDLEASTSDSSKNKGK